MISIEKCINETYNTSKLLDIEVHAQHPVCYSSIWFKCANEKVDKIFERVSKIRPDELQTWNLVIVQERVPSLQIQPLWFIKVCTFSAEMIQSRNIEEIHLKISVLALKLTYDIISYTNLPSAPNFIIIMCTFAATSHKLWYFNNINMLLAESGF